MACLETIARPRAPAIGAYTMQVADWPACEYAPQSRVWPAVNRPTQENHMTSIRIDLGLRTLPRVLASALAVLIAVPVLAQAAPAAAESGDETTNEVSERRPPPYYRPGRPAPRPYYRPAPRRVYVAPTYYPRPRRQVESLYDPMFHFGIGVNGTSVLSSNSAITDGLGSGAGFDLSVGWRLAPTFSLDFNWMMSFHDAGGSASGSEAALTHFSIDGRFFLTDKSRQMQPYIQAGIGAYVLGRDSFDYDTLTGVGFQLGGGFDFYLSRYVSIGGKLLYRGAHLDNGGDSYPSFPTESTWLSAFTYGGDIKFHF